MFALRSLVFLLLCVTSVAAWTSPSSASSSSSTRPTLSRRDWMTRAVVNTGVLIGTTTATTTTMPAWAATMDTDSVIADLETCIEKMKPIPE